MTTPTSAPVSAAVRGTTVAAVLLVAGVAAIASYAHMQHVAHREGEAWRSFLLPLSVDGLMVAASMVLLARRRAGLPGGVLPWTALLAGVGASLAANVAAAAPTTTARIVAAWPAVAFAVAFELLLQQRRPTSTQPPGSGDPRLTRGSDEASPPTSAVEFDPERSDPRRLVVPPPAVRAAPPADRAPTPSPTGQDTELADRAAELIATRDGRPPGRRVLARELGCTEHRARVLLDALSPAGTTPNDTHPIRGGESL